MGELDSAPSEMVPSGMPALPGVNWYCHLLPA